MKKQSKLNTLIYLYIKLALNKLSIISICISYTLLLAYLIFMTCYEYDSSVYINNYEDIHLAYIKDSCFVGMVLNSIILVVLISTIYVDSIGFDSVHIPISNRNTVFLAKLIAILVLIFIVSLSSFLLLIALAEIFYANFMFCKTHLYVFLYFLIALFIQLSITLFVLNYIRNSFITIIGFFSTFIMLFIGTNYSKIKDLSYLIPILDNNNYLINIPIIGISISVLSIAIHYLIYYKKNIN